MKFSKIQTETLYNTDYIRWVETTLKQLRSRDYDNVDWDNLLDEIADLSRYERQDLAINLVFVLRHLLKWQFHDENHTGTVASSITEHRWRVLRLLKDSPSLKPYIENVVDECYPIARRQAHQETGLPLETFPAVCPYNTKEILDYDFLPEVDRGE